MEASKMMCFCLCTHEILSATSEAAIGLHQPPLAVEEYLGRQGGTVLYGVCVCMYIHM